MSTVYRHVLSQQLYRLVCRQPSASNDSSPMVMEEYQEGSNASALHTIADTGYYSLRHLRPAFDE